MTLALYLDLRLLFLGKSCHGGFYLTVERYIWKVPLYYFPASRLSPHPTHTVD